jgi:hypothetical protein
MTSEVTTKLEQWSQFKREDIPYVAAWASEREIMIRPCQYATMVALKSRLVGSKGAKVSPRKRNGPKKHALGLPIGDLAQYLDHELERRAWSAKTLWTEMQSHGFERGDDDTISKWLQGDSAPRLNDLAYLAKALGYKDWLAMMAAVHRYHKA